MKELYKVFEGIITNNVKAIEAHTNQTRVLVRELEEKVNNSYDTIMSQNEEIKMLKSQMQNIQTKLYSKGT